MSVLSLHSDRLHVALLPFGAALVGVRFQGVARNLVLGFAPAQTLKTAHPYAGTLIGPIANRLAQGKITIAGKSYQMPSNENAHTLHSGDDGLHARRWDVIAQSDSSATFQTRLGAGEGGLPGNRLITACYTLAGSALTLDLKASSDCITPMNLTSHAYWNLSGNPDVGDHTLEVAATQYLPLDHDNLPKGTIASVDQTDFDFTTPRPVPLAPWLDVNFCLHDHPHQPLRPAARLTVVDGTALSVETTAPGLQVYNGAHLPSTPVAMADCPPMAPYSAIALEPQGWPDAPHHAGFPSILIGPDETFTQTTVFRLSQGREH